ncbi:LysE/ArgO family amino acid transporter [Galactobacter valiniphilus]|nr:LysE/ArgO family amino acid transporter [Galactobacter valiniphilus]
MPLSIVFTGMLSGLALIVAIGAQNAYVLRTGLSAKRSVVLVVSLVCALSDTVLIVAGVAGIGFLSSAAPWVLTLLRVAALLFLLVYGALSLRRALGPGGGLEAQSAAAPGLGAALATVLAFTWLNPHVYLDTVLFLGSLAGNYGENRWFFALGACVASWLWFFALGIGARKLRPLFAKAWTWRVLDGLIALIMFALAVGLIVELFSHA